jgi:hypothetical protein
MVSWRNKLVMLACRRAGYLQSNLDRISTTLPCEIQQSCNAFGIISQGKHSNHLSTICINRDRDKAHTHRDSCHSLRSHRTGVNIALPINRDRLYRLATGTVPYQQTGQETGWLLACRQAGLFAGLSGHLFWHEPLPGKSISVQT